jgi:hypothetical protein
VVRDTKLRHPIRRFYGVEDVLQEGPYFVESLYIQKEEVGPLRPVSPKLPTASASGG